MFVALVEMRVLTYAYRKVGVRPRYAFAVMLLTLVGGALIPILVSISLFLRTLMYWRMLIGVAIVAAVVHSLAQIVPGVGIAVPMIVPPVVAAGVGLLLAFRNAPPVAYVSGSMGALLGADLLNLGQIAALGAPIVSIRVRAPLTESSSRASSRACSRSMQGAQV